MAFLSQPGVSAAFALLSGVFLAGSVQADTINFYAGTYNCDSSGCGPNYQNNLTSAVQDNTFDTAPGDLYRREQTTSSANLSSGQLHAWSRGFVLSSATDATPFTTFSQAFIGDTFTATGVGLNGGHLYTNLTLDGSITSFAQTNQSTLNNNSYVEVYFDPVGSFNGPYTPIAAYFWGIGPNASTGHPPNATFMGVFSDLSAPINIPIDIPFGQLGSTFQMVIALGADISGTSTGGISWDASFGHTLTATLSTSPDIDLTSTGGFAGTPITQNTPEPGTASLLFVAVGALVWGGRARRFHIK